MPPRILWKGEPAWFVLKRNGEFLGVKHFGAPNVYADEEEAESALPSRHKIVRGELVLREACPPEPPPRRRVE